MKSKATIILAVILVAPAVAALAALVSAQESDVPTDITGEALTCPNGAQVQSHFVLEGDAWEVTGTLQAHLPEVITVSGPTGDVSVTPTINLVVTGDPQIGQPVTMSGAIAMTGEMVATALVDACSAAPTDTPAPTPDETDPATQPVADGDDADEDDEEADEVDLEHDDEGDEGSAGNQTIAEAIAEEFGTTPEQVLALHDQGIGFGAIFKLYLIAGANDMTVDALLAEIDEDGGGFAFGKLKKSLTEDEMAVFEDGPKNLGQLVSESNHDEGDDSEEADEDGGDDSHGNGKSKGHGKKD